ncbi:hypothetical protein [Pseudomonas sp. EpS/L25]|uniref:hypothetical protein n=1 Tax=Pseudomonas sp. EpS/L25 TaxID=1749078 RepID=UPI0007433E90|nr:hypothetical protein [Pseudomonas sp. EpS/L25]KUM44069.1 hypothetical protein AR540_20095 [Pseudomonas sp. EpS/L25]
MLPLPLRLTPLTQGKLACHPAILLGGPDQPTLLRYLEGWPKRWPHSRTLQIRFADQVEQLRAFGDDSFDFAVVQSPGRAGLEPLVRELTRVARQGVITRRR